VNVATLLERAAGAQPGRPALIGAGIETDYAGWRLRAGRLASALTARGVAPGDRVALLMGNSAAFLESLFAVFIAGAVVVPVNTRLHPKECAYMLEHSGSRALLHDARFAAALAEVELPPRLAVLRVAGDGDPYEAAIGAAADFGPSVERAPDDVAWLFYTSGTTGRPKAAMVTHGNLAFMAERYGAEVFPARPDDRVLHAGPLTHGSGLWSLPLTAAGVTHVIPASASFDPAEIFGLIERHRVTNVVFISPTMVKLLLESEASTRADCSSLRFLAYGGAPIHPDDQRAALDRWGPILCNLYGQGECPMTISMLGPAEHAEAAAAHPERLRSAGLPRGGIEVAVLGDDRAPAPVGAVGEVCVRGPVVMRGYWRNDEATAAAFHDDGWYRTGDLGSFDADGYLYLGDRVKELVISGGANVYPRELEDVIGRLDGVGDVAVIGIPDRHWGESVVAVVVPARPDAVTADAVVAACRANLASYKKPRWVVFVDALPRSAYGKVLKRELVERFAGLATGTVDA